MEACASLKEVQVEAEDNTVDDDHSEKLVYLCHTYLLFLMIATHYVFSTSALSHDYMYNDLSASLVRRC